jgi:hypothetical protein
MKRLLALTTIALFSIAPTALAKHGADDGAGDDNGGNRNRQEVRANGSCGAGATSKLKLKTDDSGLEVEFEVDRNINGEKWRVTLVRDGDVVVRTKARTKGPSGSFSVERRITDLSGADTVTARGVGPTGLTCTATATLPA